MSVEPAPIFCDKCLQELVPGKGNFYNVKIEAIADPSPPVFDESDLKLDVTLEIERLIEQTQDMSERELLDEVARRVTIQLCFPCYKDWIENPAGE